MLSSAIKIRTTPNQNLLKVRVLYGLKFWHKDFTHVGICPGDKYHSLSQEYCIYLRCFSSDFNQILKFVLRFHQINPTPVTFVQVSTVNSSLM